MGSDKGMNVLGQGYDSRAIANKILECAQKKGYRLTIMQLVKLIYFAQGWSLAFRDKPITYHPAQAWQYGPVYPHVYKAYPGSGSTPISHLITNKTTGEVFDVDLDDEEKNLIDSIVDEYGNTHAFSLSKMTHTEEGPWQKTINTYGVYAEIPNAYMKEYFKRFVPENG